MTDKVTLRDVYDVTGRLNDKIDSRFEGIEKRLENIESFQNRILGISAIISLFAGGIVTWLLDMILKKR